MSEHTEPTAPEQDALFQKKLNELLEKGKATKKIPSRQLIETLDLLDADEQTTEQMYDALEAAGVEIDVDDVLEIIGKVDELEPTSEQLSQEEEADKVDTDAISEGLALIPTEGKEERLCWEFKCEAEDGTHFIVYADALTGEEVKLLLLLEDENGTLVL